MASASRTRALRRSASARVRRAGRARRSRARGRLAGRDVEQTSPHFVGVVLVRYDEHATGTRNTEGAKRRPAARDGVRERQRRVALARAAGTDEQRATPRAASAPWFAVRESISRYSRGLGVVAYHSADAVTWRAARSTQAAGWAGSVALALRRSRDAAGSPTAQRSLRDSCRRPPRLERFAPIGRAAWPFAHDGTGARIHDSGGEVGRVLVAGFVGVEGDARAPAGDERPPVAAWPRRSR